MNLDFSNLPQEERAQRLTALLLGELPPAEVDALRATLAADPELAREHARLQQIIALVRETAAMDRKTSADGTPLRLDEQRRAKLLAAFKTPAPRAVATRRPRNFSYVPLSLAAVLVGLLALVASLPMFVKSRETSQRAERVTPLPGPAVAASSASGSILVNEVMAHPVPARGDSSQLSAPSIATISGREFIISVPKVNYAVTDLERSSTAPQASGSAALAKNLNLGETKMLGSIVAGIAPAPSSPPVAQPSAPGASVYSMNAVGYADTTLAGNYAIIANLVAASPPNARFDGAVQGSTAALGVNDSTTVDYLTTSVNDGRLGSLPATAPVPLDAEKKARAGLVGGGGSVTFQKQGAVWADNDSFSVPPSMLVANAPKRVMTPTDAQGIIEARRLQLPASGPATPGILPPTALGQTLAAEKLAADGKLFYETGRAKEAEESLRQAVQSDPENGFSVVSTNALVSNNTWDRPASPGQPINDSFWFGKAEASGVSPAMNFQWKFTGENAVQQQNLQRDGAGTENRWTSADSGVAAGTAREFFDDNYSGAPFSERGRAANNANSRVTVQLPALAGEPQLGRQSSPTRPAGGRQSELASQVSGAVVAEPAPANVTMTGITMLSGGSDLVVPIQKEKLEKGVAEQKPELLAPTPFARTNRFVARNTFVMTNASSMLDVFSGTNVTSKSAAAKVSSAESEGERRAPAKPSASVPTPQPEVLTRDNAFSTFSLNVSDVSFKLAAASLEKGAMPDVATVRSEEFINAFDYRDPMPAAGVPVAFAWERARYPFAHNRDALRFSVKTAAQGRDGGKPLNIVLLLDNSGSMERADRVQIIQEALRALAAQLQPQDKLSVVTFSRTARLWADGVTGAQAAEVAKKIAALTPEGGTNLEEALDLAYRTALRHYAATAINRVVLLTDGAANLGNVEPATLKAKVESFRKQGVALDCFGIGWEGFNDDLLENLSRNGDGRYGFVNTPEEAATEFAGQLAGALRVAASDVKVQVEFNPKRVTAYRQIGYAKHQLTKQQFRDNKVDAAEISASEAGNALYVIETNPRGEGPIATVRARFRIPQTSDYREHEWVVPFGSTVELEQSSSALRLATSASAFSEWLAGSPFAGEVTTDRLLGLLSGVPEVYGADPRPKKLEWMIRQAKSISGK